MKYTEGKWIAKKSEFTSKIQIRYNVTWCIENDGAALHFIGGDTAKEEKANAKLISKAPEMYEALKKAINTLQNKADSTDSFNQERFYISEIDKLKSLLKEIEQ